MVDFSKKSQDNYSEAKEVHMNILRNVVIERMEGGLYKDVKIGFK